MRRGGEGRERLGELHGIGLRGGGWGVESEWLILIVVCGGNEWRGDLLWGREILPHSGSCNSHKLCENSGSGEMVWYAILPTWFIFVVLGCSPKLGQEGDDGYWLAGLLGPRVRGSPWFKVCVE